MPKNSRSGAPKKARWTTAQKSEAKRAPKKAHHRGRPPAPASEKKRSYADRSARDERRGFAAGDRPARPAFRGHGDRDERAPRRFDGEGRGPRREFNRDDRPARPAFRGYGDREDRAPRREFNRDDRPADTFRRDDRPARGFDGDSRGPRREFNRDDRPARPAFRGNGDREDRAPRREFNRDDRGPRRFDRDDRRDFRPDGDRDQRHAEAERERADADTWTKATRRSVTGPVEVAEDNGFAALDLPQRMVERLARDGITTPFPIQEATIPDALAGRDVLGRGQTGSGKTLAFGLPTLARLGEGTTSAPKSPRALVMVPTRELAMQVSDALEPLVHVMGLRHKLVAGGLSYQTQIAALDRGVDLLIATPGRLNDLLERGAVNLGSIETAVLDEADHMADMGFLPEVTAILDQVPTGGQRLLFSATLDNGIDTLVDRYLTDPVTHSTDDAKASVTTMEHHVLLVAPEHKKVITAHVANRDGRTVVFVRTKLGADRVALQLREQGVMAAALHGGLNQGARNRVLGAFREGQLPVLVATDVAARGIHVDDVSVVLQVDPPADHKDYLHRSGRTARAGDRGTVVTLALPHQRRGMERQLREAGVDTTPVRTTPGDPLLTATGAREPSGVPIPEEDFRRLVDGPQRQRGRGNGGPRGSRPGGRPRSGGHYGDERRGFAGRDRGERPQRRSY